jgi:hypothetical protein
VGVDNGLVGPIPALQDFEGGVVDE